MQIIVNGKEEQLIDELTLKNLLDLLKASSPWSAVAINGSFVPRHQYASTWIKADDRIEILQPAQGG